MLIAETVQIDGWILAIFFAVMIVIALVVAAIVIGGCVAARRAGRGSNKATVVWAVIMGIEAVFLLAQVNQGGALSFVAAAVIAVQVGFYLDGRRRQ